VSNENGNLVSLRKWLAVVGVSGAIAVVAGSFVAHGLEAYLVDRGTAVEVVQRRLQQADTGVRYHLVHTVGLLALMAIASRGGVLRWQPAAILFLAGIVLFSGSLYLLVLLDEPKLGAVTPIGGACWIIGWLMLARVKVGRESGGA
jgi:uncharacterized membrane protein YgdD (TMEM256/DUF423 family)